MVFKSKPIKAASITTKGYFKSIFNSSADLLTKQAMAMIRATMTRIAAMTPARIGIGTPVSLLVAGTHREGDTT